MFNRLMKNMPSNALQWRKSEGDTKPVLYCNIHYKWDRVMWVDRSNKLRLLFWYLYGLFFYGLMYSPYKKTI